MTESPQVKKIKDLKSTGMSLREIAEKLKIQRSDVEKALGQKETPPVAKPVVKKKKKK